MRHPLAVGHGRGRSALRRLGGEGLGKLVLERGAIGPGPLQARVQRQRLLEVPPGLVVLALSLIGEAASDVGHCVVRIEAQCGVKVLNRLVVLAFQIVGDAAVEVGLGVVLIEAQRSVKVLS
jgi:hypothetical protein